MIRRILRSGDTANGRIATAGLVALVVAAAAIAASLPHLSGTAPALERVDAAVVQERLSASAAAVYEAEARVDAAPHDPDALSHLAEALLEQARQTGDPSNYDRAETALSEALEREPDHLVALIGAGSLALSRHEFAEALAIGERARRVAPDVPRVYGIIGDAQVELGRYDEALATVQTMVDIRPDLASYSRVAYLRELHGDISGAIEAMELALSAGGPTAENTEFVRTQLGDLQLAAGRIDEAERLYRGSLARLPEYVPAMGGLARVEIARGDLDSAIVHLQAATARLPLPELVVLLGETLEAAGRDDEAADQYELVEAMQRLYAASGVTTDLELAAFAADHSNPTDAVELAERAYAERPSIHAADTLAWALHRAGRSAEADRYAREAIRLGSRDPRILYHSGSVAAAVGDVERAQELLEMAIEANPAFHPIDGRRAASLLADLPSD